MQAREAAGKKIKGRKRHSSAAGRAAGRAWPSTRPTSRIAAALLPSWRRSAEPFPGCAHIFADDGYAGQKLAEALIPFGQWTLEIIKRSDAAKGFVLLPRR